MICNRFGLAALCIAVSAALASGPLWAGPEIDPKFSVDPASPAIDDHGVTPDDILVTGPSIHTEGRDLGLDDDFASGAYDDLDALSFGRDPVPGDLQSDLDAYYDRVYFSVDRVAVGLPGTAVHGEAAPARAEASGDIFQAPVPPDGSNALFLDEQVLGLEPGFFGDDLDALELDTEPDPWVYFSVDFLSIANGQGTGNIAADILISDRDGTFGTYAVHAQLGLDPKDDLDALALLDLGTFGALDVETDLALFSLDSFSPTVTDGLAAPGDILWTNFDGTFDVWATAASLGLAADDELNALDTVPLPATLPLMALGLGLLHVLRRRLRR
jgi:hypothetical protein